MKGVKTIKGNLKPKVGETNFYEVGEFHNGTVVIDPNTIKWKLYQWKDLEWFELKGPVKTGKKVTFTFPQKWYSRKLLIEAYIYEAEGKALPGLVVKPIMGENKIASIAILNNEGEKQTQDTQYGQSIIVKIGTENMLGETLRLSLWERNTVTEEGHNPFGNLKVWEGTAKIIDNNGFVEKKITLSPSFPHLAKKPLYDGSKHEYYLLVEADNKTALQVKPKVSSEIILSPGVSKPKPTPREIAIAKEKQEKRVRALFGSATVIVRNNLGMEVIKVEGVSSAVVWMPDEKEDENKGCVCKDYDLIWGNKVSCEFRKKVVEICKELWPDNKMEMANNLMAVMAWETGESFSPSVKNPNSSATGLIQFMKNTAEDLGTTTAKLAKMTAVEQLDYVKKYFKNQKGKKLEFVDFYLQVLFPSSMFKPDDHVVFSKDGTGLDENDRNYKARIRAYSVNDGFDTNPAYGNNDGMVTVAEIKKGIQKYIDKGKLNKSMINPKCSLNTNKDDNKNDTVKLHFEGQTSDESSLSQKTKDILKEVGEASKNYNIYITSTARSTYDQARIMYENCSKTGGVEKQKGIYANPGDQVIDVYSDEKNLGKTKEEIIGSMDSKIKELGPSNVSKHIADFSVMNTFDISYLKLANKNDFLSEIKKRTELDKVLIENNCYHVQINQL